jgi:hypothetical protein
MVVLGLCARVLADVPVRVRGPWSTGLDFCSTGLPGKTGKWYGRAPAPRRVGAEGSLLGSHTFFSLYPPPQTCTIRLCSKDCKKVKFLDQKRFFIHNYSSAQKENGQTYLQIMILHFEL